MKKYIFLLLLGWLKVSSITAFTLSPASQISVLTCEASEEVYARFGHTALRVCDEANGYDAVFNYGIFDYNSESFLYRFVKGETDYILGVTSFPSFVYEYANRRSGVVEQVLNLTNKEKQQLFDALQINSLPENRTYRYNYFYDNCSTRPRVLLEQSVLGKLTYPTEPQMKTYRQLVAECVGEGSWLQFGIDLLIGSPADRLPEAKGELFLPDYLMNALSHTQIDRNGDVQSLVSEQETLLVWGVREATPSTLPAPITLAWGLLVVVAIVSFFLYRCGKRGVWLDMLLFGAAGVAGCVVFFLIFFSVHPAVSPNYNLLWANPLQLIFALLLSFRALRGKLRYYQYANATVLLLALLAYPLIPQHFNSAFFPLILGLLLRSVLFLFHKKTI